jgi:hypothetical protein
MKLFTFFILLMLTVSACENTKGQNRHDSKHHAEYPVKNQAVTC